MKKHPLHKIKLLALIIFCSCKAEKAVKLAPSTKPDFTNYIAIGNSLTAGYADGGLYTEGQINSYPNIIAQQLKPFGGGAFVQALFAQGQENGSGYMELNGYDKNNKPIIDTVETDLAITGKPPVVVPGAPNFLLANYSGPLNNYGVPGIRVDKIELAGYGTPGANPYYNRLLSNAEIVALEPYRDKVLKSNPTFFTCWLGNSDALQYATNGGADSSTVPLTSLASFQDIYSRFINLLTANGVKGALGTIPDVTQVAFFNTITVAQLTIQAQALGAAGVYIKTGKGLVRLATSKDLILQTAIIAKDSSGLKKGFSAQYPLSNADVLDSLEVINVKNAVNGYNSAITSIAASKGLALMDISVLLKEIQTPGFTVNGVPLSSAYITGGAYSMDGVHLTPRGYAMIANSFITAINTRYGTTIPIVDVSTYRAIKTAGN